MLSCERTDEGENRQTVALRGVEVRIYPGVVREPVMGDETWPQEMVERDGPANYPTS